MSAADWDGDGDIDIIAGTCDGAVSFLPNISKDSVPTFGDPVKIVEIPKNRSGHIHASTCVTDWDGDGIADLLVGNTYGDVHFYKASKTEGLPKLAPAVELVSYNPDLNTADQVRLYNDPPRSGSDADITVMDWNGDGLMDLVVGDSFYLEKERKLSKKQQKRKAELEARVDELQSKLKAKHKEYLNEELERLGLSMVDSPSDIPKDKSRQYRQAMMSSQASVRRTMSDTVREFDIKSNELDALLPEVDLIGNVWVYLRKKSD